MSPEEQKKYADPRRYNLILTLGTSRLQGWFVPYGRTDVAPVKVVDTTYTPDADRTLTQIENSVYDNPILLEEYDSRIIVDTTRQLLFPAQAPQSLIEQAMNRFYECDSSDVFVNRLDSATLAFTLCRGLKSFLGRTFAGVSPMHRLTPLYKRFANETDAPGITRVYADLDAPYLHLLAFNGTSLLHASTHRAATTADAAYFIFTLRQRLGLATDSVKIKVSGTVAERRELMTLLRRHLNYVDLTLLPRVEQNEEENGFVPATILLSALE